MKKLISLIFCLVLLVSCTNSLPEKSTDSDSVFADDTAFLPIDDLSENKVIVIEKVDTVYKHKKESNKYSVFLVLQKIDTIYSR